MSTYSQIYLHIIFATKDRVPAIDSHVEKDVYRYIAGIIKEKGCPPFEINGDRDHVHILAGVRQSLAPSDLLRELKASSSLWIRKTKLLPAFNGWQDGLWRFQRFTFKYGSGSRIYPEPERTP